MSDIFVQDLRDNNSPSLSILPRIETFEELLTWVSISIDNKYGWDAAPNGSLVWKVVGFYIRDGVASFIAKFQNEDGSPASGVGVVHSWPGAPSLSNPESITPDYRNFKGVSGFTNSNGDAGFPYSGGMVYAGNKPYSGPGIIWPLCPQHLSEPKYADAVFGLGWFGGTDHTTINPIFKLVRKQNQEVNNYSLGLFQDGIDLGIRLNFIQSLGIGWELVLFKDNQQVGSAKFS